jgi:hypothetical protein
MERIMDTLCRCLDPAPTILLSSSSFRKRILNMRTQEMDWLSITKTHQYLLLMFQEKLKLHTQNLLVQEHIRSEILLKILQ